MKTNKLLIALLFLLICIAVVGCKSDEHICPPTPEPISLIGTWYEVGFTENKGIKVTFTETHCRALIYSKEPWEEPYVPLWQEGDYFVYCFYFGYGEHITYEILSDSVMQFHYPIELEPEYYTISDVGGINTTPFALNGDTLFIRRFYPGPGLIVYPLNMLEIYLTRSVQVD